MNHRARTQEQESFEKRVGHQVIDTGGKCADAHAHEHVAQLRHGGIGENLFDIVLRQADGGGKKRRGGADDGDRLHGLRRVDVDGPGARRHIDAGRDHGRGVDQR